MPGVGIFGFTQRHKDAKRPLAGRGGVPFGRCAGGKGQKQKRAAPQAVTYAFAVGGGAGDMKRRREVARLLCVFVPLCLCAISLEGRGVAEFGGRLRARLRKAKKVTPCPGGFALQISRLLQKR